MDPSTSKIVPGGIEEQTRRVMENIKALLVESGYTMDDIVKTTILLDDIGTFAAVNTVYGSYFAENPPARATYEVGALPLGALIEIDAIACRKP